MSRSSDFPAHFFDRDDPSADARFYAVPRMVTHIDDRAVRAVGDLYGELGVDGPESRVLDLMSSWTSHLHRRPGALTVLGMNAEELAANRWATERVVADLNADPTLPFADAAFDAVLCCVSIDYLVRPVEVLAEAARVLRPGGSVVITFSDRCFPTKAVLGWLSTDDAGHLRIVVDYLRRAGGFEPPETGLRTPSGPFDGGDPLYAVVARRSGPSRPPAGPGT